MLKLSRQVNHCPYNSAPLGYCSHMPKTYTSLAVTYTYLIFIFHMHAYITDTLIIIIGLTSSLDSLLSATFQAKLSEYSIIPAKETDSNTNNRAPISDQSPQKTTASGCIQIKLPTTSHTGDQELVKGVKNDSTHTSDTTDHSETTSERTLTDLNVQAKNSSDTDEQSLTFPDSSHQDHSTKGETVVISGQTASTDAFSTTSDPHQVILRCNDKLVTALSADPQGIAGILLAKGLIPENTEAQMRQCSTPYEKATILVTTVRQRIEIAPKRFDDFVDILSKQEWTKDITEILQSSINPKRLRKDAGIRVASSDGNSSIHKGRKSSDDVSSNGKDYIFPKLNSEDKAELEAQLILSADSMRKKFASLLVNVINSFQHQGVDPRRLASTVLALVEYDDPAIGKPLLEREKHALMTAQNVDDSFDVLRPHMTFFNYEILEFLIEQIGSLNDRHNLQKFLQEFERFCRRSVFEIPPNVLGHSAEKVVDQQKFCVKVTKQFKAALLVQCMKQPKPDSQTTSSTQLSSSQEDKEGTCAPELGISLEDAKHIQRKFASVLKLKVSSIYLDSVTSGSVILTFLLPARVLLAGLDSDPDIIALSSNGLHILCGPPGKPEPKELTSNGLVVQWSQPEYGRLSLAKYILYFRKKHSEAEPLSEWQKLELSSLETHTCAPDLSDGDTYVFKICTVSDVGTLQYSNESDPAVVSANRILTKNVHKVIVDNKDILASVLSSTYPVTILSLMLSIKGIISKDDEAQISLASTPNEKAILLITAIESQIKSEPEKFQNFLNAFSEAKLSLPSNIVETLWSDYYNSVYKQYLDHLKFLYTSLGKKQISNQWPPSATKKFFRLAMIKTTEAEGGYIDDTFVRMTITGKVDDILQEKFPIQLEDIFKETEGQRKVILLEGAPGCGKSTLSVYICQQWEKGQLFDQFKFVILIRLRDPEVKSAKGLADLLPCPDTTAAQQIAARMLANKCQDVLFILDGWDELPPNLRINSIFYQLLQPELPKSNPLCESTVIVTSRPIASGDLHQVVSSRVEILGFTAKKLHQFFTECLKGDTEAVKTLLERIEENPEVAGSCYLPLNATILVHLFKSDRNTLPTTLYGIFSNLVLNCIKRHLKLRTPYKDVSIESLDLLPEFAKKPFTILCQLAYDGVMEDKIVFSSLQPDINTLSLLQGVESFIGREKAISHNFIHLSIQELLAAWYIATQLPAYEQVSKFNKLFNQSRFGAVFRFYAAITKLKTPGIKDVVIRVASSEEKSLLVSLLHCFFEAQDLSLYESVAQQLQPGLYLKNTTLTPSDCLCIGYFLAHVCKMAAGEFTVSLRSCGIGDQGCKYLVSGIHKCLGTDNSVTTLLHMDMQSNDISHHGVYHLSTLLNINRIIYLKLSFNILFEQDTICAPLATFAEQLTKNATLRELWLMECGLNSRSAKSYAQALTTNKMLEVLDISNNALCDDGIKHLAHALRVNQGLKILYLVSCCMTDVGLECLAKSLQQNTVLKQLLLWNSSINSHKNRLTEKIVPILTECLRNNHTLTELVLPMNFKSSVPSIGKAVNDVRKRRGLQHIRVSGMSYL